MVDTIPPDKLSRWMAVARIAGWDDEWTMASTVASAVNNVVVQLMARAGFKPDRKELLSFDHFEPDVRTGRKPIKIEPLTQQQLEAHHRAMAGLR